jgi:hypothetical protein
VLLFIRADDDTNDIGLFPADMLCAVVGADIGGEGPSRWLSIRQPFGLELPNGAVTSPLFEQGDPSKPMWLRVDRSYAGTPRPISSKEYETICTDLFFFPSGYRYDPFQQVRMPRSGEYLSMEEVLKGFFMLRRLKQRVPEDFAHLGLVAQDPMLSVRPPGRPLCGFARRTLELEPTDELGDRGRILLSELLVFNHRLQRAELVKPWHRSP